MQGTGDQLDKELCVHRHGTAEQEGKAECGWGPEGHGGLGNEGCQSVPASGCNLIPTSVLQLGSNEQAELGRGGRKGHHCL